MWAFGPTATRGFQTFTASLLHCFTSQRQRHDELRPAPHFGIDSNAAAVVAHDAVADAQAKAGALPDRLGGEERVEDFRAYVRRDAAAGVGDFDANVAVCTRPAAHRHPPAGVARVDRVGHEVHHHLVDLRGIAR